MLVARAESRRRNGVVWVGWWAEVSSSKRQVTKYLDLIGLVYLAARFNKV